MGSLWKTLEVGPKDKVPNIVYAVVEVSKGSTNKYEIDLETGVLRLDRIFYTAMRMPGNYGFIPRSLALDGDPLDVLVLSTYPVYPKTVMKTKPIGVLRLQDEEGIDDKIIATSLNDPGFEGIDQLEDIPKSIKKEILHFFEHYKELEPGKWVKFKSWGNKKVAKKIINRAIKLYKRRYSKYQKISQKYK